MTAQQVVEQIQFIRKQLDEAENARHLPINHILVALATLTDIVEQIAKRQETSK